VVQPSGDGGQVLQANPGVVRLFFKNFPSLVLGQRLTCPPVTRISYFSKVPCSILATLTVAKPGCRV